MSKRSDPRIDAYIAAAAPFAQPSCATCGHACMKAPAAEETMKWGSPHFQRGGALFC